MLDRQLLESCRLLRAHFSKPNSVALSPEALAPMLPHIREVLTGVEDLGDRMSLVELALRSIRREEVLL